MGPPREGPLLDTPQVATSEGSVRAAGKAFAVGVLAALGALPSTTARIVLPTLTAPSGTRERELLRYCASYARWIAEEGPHAGVWLVTEPHRSGQLHLHGVMVTSRPNQELKARWCARLRANPDVQELRSPNPKEGGLPRWISWYCGKRLPNDRDAWVLGSFHSGALVDLWRRALSIQLSPCLPDANGKTPRQDANGSTWWPRCGWCWKTLAPGRRPGVEYCSRDNCRRQARRSRNRPPRSP